MPPDVKFIRTGCYMPSRCVPCVKDTTGTLAFANQGDSGDCCIIVSLKGVYYWLWPKEGESGWLDTDQRVDSDLNTHFPKEDFPVSETVTVTFYAGYPVGPNKMVPTDQISFDIYIRVKETDWVLVAMGVGITVGVVAIGYTMLKPKVVRI